jgi:glucose-1-phosphate thymidylyltransferase
MKKGIILAGGSGSRLFPATLAISKQLLPVFDKPMIYYPLSILMLANIREILIISTPEDLPRFQKLFRDGSHLGLRFSYKEQAKPQGLAQAFLIGKEFIGKDPVLLILGDNIFYGHDLPRFLNESVLDHKEGGLIFAYRVQDPERYGVVSFQADGKVESIEEKPKKPKSSYAIPGLYLYDNEVVRIAESLTPSKRGELEITDIHRAYLQKGKLQVKVLGRGYAWLDAGTHDALQRAALFVQTIEERQGIKIACIEEIAYQMGYINEEKLQSLVAAMQGTDYGRYLSRLLIKE